MNRRCLTIFQEGFGQGCLSLCKIRRVDIMVRSENSPWSVELGEKFIEDIVEVFYFFDDIQ